MEGEAYPGGCCRFSWIKSTDMQDNQPGVRLPPPYSNPIPASHVQSLTATSTGVPIAMHYSIGMQILHEGFSFTVLLFLLFLNLHAGAWRLQLNLCNVSVQCAQKSRPDANKCHQVRIKAIRSGFGLNLPQ
ncbi:hypothetical protein BJY01DRAFT_217468 [Aspergillus pseudoustus]|uniref:Uncharacterized protein n=1 Tax=Aspergillus pseudoustus TaxID=1810923 RepID=A0ABR4JN10_9EURO